MLWFILYSLLVKTRIRTQSQNLSYLTPFSLSCSSRASVCTPAAHLMATKWPCTIIGYTRDGILNNSWQSILVMPFSTYLISLMSMYAFEPQISHSRDPPFLSKVQLCCLHCSAQPKEGMHWSLKCLFGTLRKLFSLQTHRSGQAQRCVVTAWVNLFFCLFWTQWSLKQ